MSGSPNIRNRSRFILWTFALLLVPALLRAQQVNLPRNTRLTFVQGDVRVRLAGDQTAKPAVANAQLSPGETIVTGIGLAEIEFEDGATAYAGDNTSMELTELSSAVANGVLTRATLITVTQGIARFYANTRGIDTFSVASSGERVAPRPLADFRVEAEPNGTIVRTLNGNLQIIGMNTTWDLRQGQTWSLATGALEAKVTEAPILNRYGWLPLWPAGPPPYSSWLKTPPYSVPIPLAVPPVYTPYGPQLPRSPAPPSYPRFPEVPPPFPERPPRFPQ